MSNVNDVIPLNSKELRSAEGRAKRRYTALIGQRPTRKSVAKDYPLKNELNVLHFIGLLVAIFMFAVTLVKVFEDQSIQAARSYEWFQSQGVDVAAYIELSQPLVTTVFQVAFAFATEFSLILFLVWFRIEQRKRGFNWREIDSYFSFLPLFMAFLSTAYILYVNFVSGGNIITNIIPPAATFTVALVFENAITLRLARREELRGVVSEKQTLWDRQMENYETDPRYLDFWYLEVSEALVRVRRGGSRPNRWLQDADQEAILAASQHQRDLSTQRYRAAKRESLRLRAGEGKAKATDYRAGRVNSKGKIVPPSGSWSPMELADRIRENWGADASTVTVQEAQKVFANVNRPLWNQVTEILR